MAEEPAVPGWKKGVRGKLWILFAALALLVAGDLGMRAWHYFKRPDSSSAASHPEAAKKDAAAPGEAVSGKALAAKSTLSLDPFLVNLADSPDVRFVKVTFQLGLAEQDEATTKNPVVIAATRDAIISLLSSKTSEQILTAEGKNKLRQEVRDRVNAFFAGSKAKVQDVYIVEFVVQL